MRERPTALRIVQKPNQLFFYTQFHKETKRNSLTTGSSILKQKRADFESQKNNNILIAHVRIVGSVGVGGIVGLLHLFVCVAETINEKIQTKKKSHQ